MLAQHVYLYQTLVTIAPSYTPFGWFVLQYLGPESAVPLASCLASLVGLLLIFWRHVTSAVRQAVRTLFKRSEAESASKSDAERGSETDSTKV